MRRHVSADAATRSPHPKREAASYLHLTADARPGQCGLGEFGGGFRGVTRRRRPDDQRWSRQPGGLLSATLTAVNTASAQLDSPRDRRPAALAACVAALVAVGAGTQAAGLSAISAAILGPTPGTIAWVMVVCLVASAVGLMLPEQLVVHFVRFAWARVRGVPAPDIPAGGNRHVVRHGVLWLALAAILVAAAAAAMMALAGLTLMDRFYPRLLGAFLWTPAAARTAECLASMVVLSPLLILYGVSLTFVHAVYRRPDGGSELIDLPALVVVSLAGGIAVGQVVLLPRSTASHVVLLGVGLLCVAALLSVLAAGIVERRAIGADQPTAHVPPEAADTVAAVLLCVGTWGFVLGTLVVSVSSAAAPAGLLSGCAALCGFLAATGVGVGVGSRAAPRSGALWPFSGAMLLTAVLCLIALCVARRLGGPSAGVLAVIGAMALGTALAAGRGGLATRLAGESRRMAEALAAALVGSACGVSLAKAWLVPWLCWPAGVALAGLVAATAAGVLAATDRRSSVTTSVAMTAAALTVLLGFAVAPRPRTLARAFTPCAFAGRSVEQPGSGAGPVWLEAPRDVIPDADLLAWLRHLAGSPFAPLEGVVVQPGWTVRRVRWVPVSQQKPPRMEAATLHGADARYAVEVLVERTSDAAWRMLQVGLGRYDLIVVGPRDSGVCSQAFWSSEFLRSGRRRLVDGGLAVVVVRPSAVSSADLITLTATFAAVFPEGGCVAAELNGRDVLALVGCRGDGDRLPWQRLARPAPAWAGGYDAVLVAGGAVEIHSLRQPRLRGKGAAATVAGLLAGRGWQRLVPGDSP